VTWIDNWDNYGKTPRFSEVYSLSDGNQGITPSLFEKYGLSNGNCGIPPYNLVDSGDYMGNQRIFREVFPNPSVTP
jgi:hypothetical protein